jgi:hypothetical protein
VWQLLGGWTNSKWQFFSILAVSMATAAILKKINP